MCFSAVRINSIVNATQHTVSQHCVTLRGRNKKKKESHRKDQAVKYMYMACRVTPYCTCYRAMPCWMD